MDIESGMNGVKIEADEGALTVSSRRTMHVLSSAVLNGGYRHVHSIMNYHVSNDFNLPNPEALLKRAASRLKLRPPTVGLMTAVTMRNLSVKKERREAVVALVTAGLSYPAAAGDKIELKERAPGTINIIVLIDAALAEGAMVEAVKTATEAKVLALGALDVRSRFSGELASGTTTDSVCIACTGKGGPRTYAGTATRLGQAIGRSVRAGVEEAVQRRDGIVRARPALARLNERGLTLDSLADAGMELFLGSKSVSRTKARSLLRRSLSEALTDVNVSALVLAAIRLDEEGGSGSFPGMDSASYLKDPIDLVADEAIGAAIADYIAGTLGVHNFRYYDRMKPGVIKTLSPFMDDAIGGLVAGVMSKVLREKMRR